MALSIAEVSEKVSRSSARYPYTTHVRDFLHASTRYKTEEGAIKHTIVSYTIGLRVWDSRTGEQVFLMNSKGNKNYTIEYVYKHCYEALVQYEERMKTSLDFLPPKVWKMNSCRHVVQGLDEELPTKVVESEEGQKTQNVVVVGDEKPIFEGTGTESNEIITMCATEKIYNFSEDTGIMNRWISIKKQKLNSGPEEQKQYIDIIDGILKAIPNSINMLPIHGFVYGRYTIEMRLIIEAQPAQAGLVMMSYIPNHYGLINSFVKPSGLTLEPEPDGQGDDFDYGNNTIVYDTIAGMGYHENYCAVQRSHVIVDVNKGGDAILVIPFKYHKSFVRNYDYAFDLGSNPGIMGANYGKVMISVISSLTAGAGQPSNASYQVFVRFVDSHVTAMTPATLDTAQANKTKIKIGWQKKLKGGHLQKIQGPVMSALPYVKAGADWVSSGVKIAENINVVRGRRITNRDKPVCNEATVRSIPRPRQDFHHGSGLDDAIKMCIRPEDLTSFYETFNDEPRSFAQLTKIPSFAGSFKWTSDNPSGTVLMSSNFRPNAMLVNGDETFLKNLVGISSSMFTTYRGTVQLLLQMVKTDYHHGSLEVQISYGRNVEDSNYGSTYVKVCKVQENSGFQITIPYIHDVPARFLGNSSCPTSYPNMFDPNRGRPISYTTIKIRVLNELVAPTLVEQSINVLVWIKAGDDFTLMNPIPLNTIVQPANINGVPHIPKDFRALMTTKSKYPGWKYKKGAIERFETFEHIQAEEDFETGESIPNVISSLGHQDFKDLLKVPIEIIHNLQYIAYVKKQDTTQKKYVTYQQVVNLPVAPPSNTLIAFLSGHAGGINVDMGSVARSVQYNILSMFGLYRGTIDLTFVFRGARQTIYISYVPHDFTIGHVVDYMDEPITSTTTNGAVTLRFFDRNRKESMGPSGLGMQTIMVSPTVNPTEKIQIPMTTPNNWLLMNRDLRVKNGIRTLREMGEWFNGVVKVWSTDNFNMDVFVSCGDDFELGGFLGHTGVINWYADSAPGDDFRHEVQGFPSLERVYELNPNVRQYYLTAKEYLINLGLENVNKTDIIFLVMSQLASWYIAGLNIQPITVMYVTARAVASLRPWIKLTNQVDQLVEGPIPDAIRRVEGVIDEVTKSGPKIVMDYLLQAFPFVSKVEGAYTKFLNITKEIIHAIIARDWKTTAFSFACILTEVGLLTMESLSEISDKVQTFFRSYFGMSVQGDGDFWEVTSDFADAIISVLAVTFRCKYFGGLKWFFIDTLAMSSKFTGTLNGTLGLIRKLIMVIKRIVNYFLKEKDPNVAVMEQFAGRSADIEQFIDEAMLFINPMNKTDFKRAEQRTSAIALILRAHKLYGYLIKLQKPQITLPLINLCKQVIKVGEEYQAMFRNHIVKKEPFVIMIEGHTNVGKSFSITELAPELLEDIGVRPRNPDYIFTVSPGIEYWNGYKDQSVVVYDDWCNLGDEKTMSAHISQLYALKTSQPFNVPMAELENKERLATPHVVILSTNVPFPSHPMFKCPEAIYRRRDVRIKYVLKSQYTSLGQVPVAVLDAGDHIDVHWYENAFDPQAKIEIITWKEMKERLKKKHHDYHEQEVSNMRKKYERLNRIVQGNSIDTLSFQNPFQILEDANVELPSGKLTSELLELELNKLVEDIQANFTTNGESVSAGGNVVQGMGFFEIKEWMKDVTAKTFRGINRILHRCELCGELCQYKSTALECPEGHFVCVGCATNPHATDDRVFLQCPIHGNQCQWYFPPLLKVFMVNALSPAVDCLRWLTSLKSILLSENHIAMKIAMSVILYWRFLIRRIFTNVCQGGEDYDLDPINEIDEIIMEYTPEKHISFTKLKIKQEEVVHKLDDKMEIFVSVPISQLVELRDEHGSRVYKCPHSLLRVHPESYFGEGKYHIEREGSHFSVDSTCCNNVICELKDYEFVKGLMTNFEVPRFVIKDYLQRNRKVILKYFPMFMWPEGMERTYDTFNVEEVTSKDWWNTYVSPLGEWFNKILKTVLPVVVVVSGVYLVFKMATFFIDAIMRWLGFSGLCQAGESGAYSDSDGLGRSKVRTRIRGRMRTQGDNLENKLNVIANNYVIIKSGDKICIGLGVKGSVVLLPRHTWDRIGTYFTVEFTSGKHETTEFLKDNCVVTKIQDRDVVLVDVQTKLFFKDITKFMKEGGEVLGGKATVIELNPKTGEMGDVDVDILGIVQRNVADDFKYRNSYVTMNAIRYNYQKLGACGSVLVDNSIHPIVGIHISGNDKMAEGCASPIYRRDIENARDVIQMEDTGDDVMVFADANVEYLGSVPKDMSSHIPSKSKIVKSGIDKYFEKPNVMEPAILSKEDPRWKHSHSPLHHGIKKHGKPTRDFHPALLLRAFTFLCSITLKGKHKRHIRTPTVLSEKQAAVGLDIVVDDPYNVDESLYYDCIDESTSSGWPYSVLSREKKYGIEGTSKKDWLNYHRDEQGMVVDCLFHPVLDEHLRVNKALRRKGTICFNVFQDCLKDEKRPKAKVYSEGGTRVFSMSNVECTIALRKYTLDLTSFLRFNRLENWIAIGINPESEEWTFLAIRLLEIGDNIFTTDFSNFGPGLNAFLVEKFGDFICEYYRECGVPLTDEETTEVKTLMIELSNSLHIVCNTVYRTRSGSPSGACVTAELNSAVHLMLVFVSWMYVGAVCRQITSGLAEEVVTVQCPELEKELRKHGMARLIKLGKDMNLETLADNLYGCVYGDDGIFSVSDEYKDVFNSQIINLVLKEFGIGVTDATKVERITPYTKLEDAVFLKRKFVRHSLFPDTFWLAAIDWNTVEECTRWVHKNLDFKDATRDNCEAALRLAFGHGREKYEKFREQINEWLLKEGIREIHLSWVDIHRQCFPNIGITDGEVQGGLVADLELEDDEYLAKLSKQYKRECLKNHPDRGGNTAEFIKNKEKYDQLVREYHAWKTEGHSSRVKENAYDYDMRGDPDACTLRLRDWKIRNFFLIYEAPPY